MTSRLVIEPEAEAELEEAADRYAGGHESSAPKPASNLTNLDLHRIQTRQASWSGRWKALIHNRDRLVASVLGPEDTKAFLAWRARQTGALAGSLREAQRICEQEGYSFELPHRADRSNPILRVADARRHQRHE